MELAPADRSVFATNAHMLPGCCVAHDAAACRREGRVAHAYARAFWMFVAFSVAGLLVEEAYHLALFGEFQSRVGLLFGPFSPIYGIGGLCAAAVAKGLRDKPLAVAFLVFCVTGGAIEYAVSFVLESAFGIVAWDYTGSFLSVGGRTNVGFMAMWGVLGIVCVKVLVPAFERRVVPVIDGLPSAITLVASVLMAANIALTLVSFNCWFHRMEGVEPSTPVQIVCSQVFGDDFMEARFQAMNIDPLLADR